MNKKANNYMVIVIVLLLVVAIITGAGLCYLSWSDEPGFSIAGNQSGSTLSSEEPEHAIGTTISGEDLEQAKEEGRQEIIDNIKENLDANISAEEILNGLIGEEITESSTESEEEAKEEKGLTANNVTMEQIVISSDGEYQYIHNGQTASHKGIDVSKYQKSIDWKKVKADGVEYAFIRVGCRGYGSSGTLIKDETFHQNVKGALAQGIEVGAYFFSQAVTVEEALEEAELVIEEVGHYDITYPVAIDIERIQNDTARQDALSKQARTEICIAFCERIKEAGFIPMVYGDLETFEMLLDAEMLSAYDFWICETDGKMTFPYEFAVWQYSHTGKVSGISTDTNISISIKEW